MGKIYGIPDASWLDYINHHTGEVQIIPKKKHLDPQGFPRVWALVNSNVGLVQLHPAFTDTHL
jgi:hypothetical protein